MDPLVKLANKSNLLIIEDACQAHGAKYKNTPLPYTETGAFSFYPGKNLGCFGDGGGLVTSNPKIAKKVLLLRNDGSIKKYEHQLFGYKSRLDTLQGAILNKKLSYLPDWNKARRKHAQRYTKFLKSVEKIKTPIEVDYAHHVYHLYVIETPERNLLQSFLKKHNIVTGIHYPIPIHLQLPYRKKGYKIGHFPITETKAKRILSLPMFPELREEEIDYVVEHIDKFVKSQKSLAL
jgi:dTDP-4-amino-4,6-dideoxygalactose transaminase